MGGAYLAGSGPGCAVIQGHKATRGRKWKSSAEREKVKSHSYIQGLISVKAGRADAKSQQNLTEQEAV